MRRIGQFLLVLVMATATLLPSAPASAASGGCSSVSGRAKYIVCVDVSSQRAWLRRVTSGVVGTTVIGPYTVTTSRYDSGVGDSLTRQGHFVAYNAMRYSITGLEYFIRFYNGQGLHAYPYVGAGYDSHGCVRQTYWVARELYRRLVTGSEGNLVAAGRVEVHIYP